MRVYRKRSSASIITSPIRVNGNITIKSGCLSNMHCMGNRIIKNNINMNSNIYSNITMNRVITITINKMNMNTRNRTGNSNGTHNRNRNSNIEEYER